MFLYRRSSYDQWTCVSQLLYFDTLLFSLSKYAGSFYMYSIRTDDSFVLFNHIFWKQDAQRWAYVVPGPRVVQSLLQET